MGTPKPIYLLDAKVRALQLTDLFPVRDPVAGNGPAHKYTLQDVVNLIGAVVAAANDGLSQVAGVSKLGQSIAAAGDPSKLLEAREIVLNGNTIAFVDRATGNIMEILPDGSLAFNNSNGSLLQAQWTLGADSTSFNINTDDGKEIIFDFAGGVASMVFNSSADGNLERFDFSQPVISTGSGDSYDEIDAIGTPALTMNKNHGTIIYDTSGGNGIVNINPSLFPKQKFTIKKRLDDLNTITLNNIHAAGKIFGSAGNASTSSFIFSDPGESVTIQASADGINLMVI